jgi:hypothetical protein
MKRILVSGMLLTTSFLLLALYGSAPLIIPEPAPTSIPMDQFSAERAMQHVQVLAQSPRVVGSEGMEQAVGYVTNVLQTCGYDPDIQEATSPKGVLRNVIARIPGRQPSNTILILSHLDSISYGAGDNASGAAVLLEAACALKAGAPLQKNVILLFEDGEEAGYLGGYAFAASNESLSSIQYVIGLDTAAWGPVILLQTTPDNAELVEAYARSVKLPAAFGFFADADWAISADSSEIQPFYERDIPGLELEDPTAFIGKHSTADTVEMVKPGSLQQMGDQALSLTRLLGDVDPTETSSARLSYFALWGLGLVHYPATWNLAFVLLSAIGLGVLIRRDIRQKVMAERGITHAAVFLLLSFIGAGGLGVIGSYMFSKLFPNSNPNIGSYLLPASLPFFVAVLTLIVLAYLTLRATLVKHFSSPAVQSAGLILWTLIALLVAVLLPVGSYLLAIPLSIAVLVGFFPADWKVLRILPAAATTVLSTPNVILAFLGTGMETLVLVALLLVLAMELWTDFELSMQSEKDLTFSKGNA